MDFCIRFYCLLAFLTLQILASNLKESEKLYLESSSTPDDTATEILIKPYLELERTKAKAKAPSGLSNKEKTALSNAEKSYFSWWPSKVDYSDTINEVLEPSTSFESRNREVEKPAATFEEIEKQNANIYNPLLNHDRYQIPEKRYTFVELEDMNANRYNPNLN